MDNIRLAIVDDEEDILQALKRLLRKQFDVVTFTSAQACLTHLESQPVAILLSDIRMPFMDGFDLMRKVKQSYPDTTRLCISGYADIEECQQAINDGLFEFVIAKPWDNFELKQLLTVFAKKHSLEQQVLAMTNENQAGASP